MVFVQTHTLLSGANLSVEKSRHAACACLNQSGSSLHCTAWLICIASRFRNMTANPVVNPKANSFPNILANLRANRKGKWSEEIWIFKE